MHTAIWPLIVHADPIIQITNFSCALCQSLLRKHYLDYIGTVYAWGEHHPIAWDKATTLEQNALANQRSPSYTSEQSR